VVTHSDCQQIASLSGCSSPRLNLLLARGLTEALDRDPVSVSRLVHAQRLMRNVDSELVEKVRDQTIRFREKVKAERKTRGPELSKLAAS
jgi:hypothetical protein